VVLGNHDEAIKIFGRSLEIKPDRAESLNGMAFAYFEKGDTQSAIAYYEKSLSIDGSNYDALSGLKNSYQKLQRPDIANSYETALQSLG
jgi:tetratricopeptide (TPR) repeat protein